MYFETRECSTPDLRPGDLIFPLDQKSSLEMVIAVRKVERAGLIDAYELTMMCLFGKTMLGRPLVPEGTNMNGGIYQRESETTNNFYSVLRPGGW